MIKKILILIVLILTLSGCAIDRSNQGSEMTATPDVAQVPELPTSTADILLPVPSSSPGEVPEATSEAGTTPSELPAATPTLDIKDIQVDVAPVAGAVESPIYIVQPGTPTKLENFLQPAAGCNWTGVAGQVFDVNQMPITGLVVEVGGKLEGSDILRLTLTGGSQSMGPGGFEIPLTDHVVASHREIYIQVFDLDGKPLSDQIYFDTYASCQENLVMINFVATVNFSNFQYLPVINTAR